VQAGTLIRTLDGLLPVEYLNPGDRIVTRDGALRLMSLAVAAHPKAELVCIRATMLGLDQPERDLWLAPGQRLMIRDWRAQVLCGQTAAAIPAVRLVDGEFIQRCQNKNVRLFTLRFQDDAVIWAEGLELVCPSLADPARQDAALTI
jgi:hypothetical protein